MKNFEFVWSCSGLFASGMIFSDGLARADWLRIVLGIVLAIVMMGLWWIDIWWIDMRRRRVAEFKAVLAAMARQQGALVMTRQQEHINRILEGKDIPDHPDPDPPLGGVARRPR